MVEHETLKTKLRKEFDRLNITEESTKDQITAELNRLSQFFIETMREHAKSSWYERRFKRPRPDIMQVQDSR